MIKKLSIIAVAALLVLTGCSGGSTGTDEPGTTTPVTTGEVTTPEATTPEVTTPEVADGLDQEDTRIINDIKEAPFGATGPAVQYVYDGKAVIMNYNGILIYDMKDNAIIDTIDNVALDLNKIQGSDVTGARATGEKIAFANSGSLNDSAYVYDIKNKKLEKSDEATFKALYNLKFVTDFGVINKVLQGSGNAIYDDKNGLVTLSYDPADPYSIKLTQWDKNGDNMVSEHVIFTK